MKQYEKELKIIECSNCGESELVAHCFKGTLCTMCKKVKKINSQEENDIIGDDIE